MTLSFHDVIYISESRNEKTRKKTKTMRERNIHIEL
jgi:hypothetical protein